MGFFLQEVTFCCFRKWLSGRMESEGYKVRGSDVGRGRGRGRIRVRDPVGLGLGWRACPGWGKEGTLGRGSGP